MRDMHKWKDKVELSLDNRQIFFVFFGLSVVGCFVFALGVMAGKRLDFQPEGEGHATADAAGLDALAAEGLDDGFQFKDGLGASAANDLPQTRDPAVPPRSDEEVAAEKAALAALDSEDRLANDGEGEAPIAKLGAKPAAKPAAAAPVKPADAALASSGGAATAGTAAKADAAPAPAGKRAFTLQFKAFSSATEAQALADKLTKNGHDVRVDQTEVKGRTWHRVRMGAFDSWDEALIAKEKFEKTESMIAYVMTK